MITYLVPISLILIGLAFILPERTMTLIAGLFVLIAGILLIIGR